MGSLTAIGAIAAIGLLALCVAGLGGIWLGYEMGTKHTEKRWDNAVTRAGVRVVRRCGICGFNRGEGIT